MFKPERELHRPIRAQTKYFQFEWQLDGFDQIPFVSEHPIYGPCFTLGTPAAAVWQLLILKDIQDVKLAGKQAETATKESFLKAEPGKEVSSVSDGEVVTNGLAKETAEKNEEETVEKKADIQIKELEDMLKLKEVNTTEAGTTETNVATQTGITVIRKEWEKKSDTVETKEKVLGFRLMKTAEGSIWEIVDYDVTVRAGNSSAMAASLKKDSSKGEKISAYKYLSKTNLGEWDLFQEKTITIEVLIEYKCIDLDPLYLEMEGNCMTENCCYLFKNPKYADIILKAGDVEIPAHRSVLCVRAYHFDVDLQELQTTEQSKIELDLDESVAEAMLKFIYCRGVPVDFPLEKCPALHSAAEKYRVSGLKATCSEFFKRYMDPEVCLKCLGVSSAEEENLVLKVSKLGEECLRNILAKEGCSHTKV